MERNFSVDDIVGTLWKLDTNHSNHTTTSSSNNPAADPTAFSFGLEIAFLHDELFRRIPRVDSDRAIHDYFKHHDSVKADGSDVPERSMRRNDSMWFLQEFLKNYDLIDTAKADSKVLESTTKLDHSDDGCTLDLNASPSNAPTEQLDPAGNSSEVVGGRTAPGVQGDCRHVADENYKHNTKFSDSHSTGEDSNAIFLIPTMAEVTVGVRDHQHGPKSRSRASYRLRDSAVTSNFSEATEVKDDSTSIGSQLYSLEPYSDDTILTNDFRERQVSGALNPLFTGLQNVTPNIGNANPQEYEMMLKRQLDLACAAVASNRALQRLASSDSHASTPEILRVETDGSDATQYGDWKVSAPIGIPALPPKPTGALSGSARIDSSGSSGERSDDEADVESGVGDQGAGPDDLRRMRRMLSNRESARRSRRRKQAHLSDLEIQIAQMRVENSLLFKHLTDITQKLNSALVDNRVLKSDVEALRAKVKLAEDLLVRSTAPAVWTDAKNKAATPSILQCGVTDQQPQALGAKMGRTPSMQRVASLEHLQKKIRGSVTPFWGPTRLMEGQSKGVQGPTAGK